MPVLALHAHTNNTLSTKVDMFFIVIMRNERKKWNLFLELTLLWLQMQDVARHSPIRYLLVETGKAMHGRIQDTRGCGLSAIVDGSVVVGAGARPQGKRATPAKLDKIDYSMLARHIAAWWTSITSSSQRQQQQQQHQRQCVDAFTTIQRSSELRVVFWSAPILM